MTIPKHCKMAEITKDIEGLRGHLVLLSLVPEPQLTQAQRRWRGWFVHTLLSAARHYSDARFVILQQIASKQTPEGGAPLPILDFGEYIDDCVSSLNRLCMCAKRLKAEVPSFDDFLRKHKNAAENLRIIRNEQEHLYNKIGGADDSGPIVYVVAGDENGIELRNMQLAFSDIYELIEAAFVAIVPLFPNFDPSSKPNQRGVPSISGSMSVTVKEA